MRKWLGELRKKEGLTLFELGELVGISEAYLSMVESGKRNPSVDVAKRLGTVLEFDWTRIFEKEVG